MNEFVIGDIHGQYDKLVKCLELANVQPEDKIVQIGDIVDRGPDPFSCIDLLKKFNTVFIRGNHDEEFDMAFLCEGRMPMGGDHGTLLTIEAWLLLDDEAKIRHKKFFQTEQITHHIDDKNRFFVHGGFNRHFFVAEQTNVVFLWDRDLLTSALGYGIMNAADRKQYPFKIKDKFKEIYVGHTPTTFWNKTKPMGPLAGKIWDVDTGSGKGGLLTIMDINTKQFWQA